MNIIQAAKAIPWPQGYQGSAQANFSIELNWPVVDHERLLVATFIPNKAKVENRLPWRDSRPLSADPFRLVCSRKALVVRVITAGGRPAAKVMTLRGALARLGVYPSTACPDISPADKKKLEAWLKAALGRKCVDLMVDLAEWTEEAIARSKGELLDSDVQLCPDELPAGLVDYIRRFPLEEDAVLLYKRGNVRGTCFSCGRKVRAMPGQRFRQHEYTTCPECGRRVVCYLEDGAAFKSNYVGNVATAQKGLDGQTLFIRQWHILRDLTAKWKDIPAQLQEVARYAVRGDHVAKWVREEKLAWGLQYYRLPLKDWERRRNVSDVYDGDYYFFVPRQWPDIVAGTSLQYCDLREIGCSNPIRLLLSWPRYPLVEKLWKAGYTKLVNEKTRYAGDPCVGWQKKSAQIRTAFPFPYRVLKLMKPEEWTHRLVKKTAALWRMVQNGRIKEKDIKELLELEVDPADLEMALGFTSAHKLCIYLNKQVVVGDSHDVIAWVARDYKDYLQDCLKLELDLKDKAVLFPPNLSRAHDRTIAQVRQKADQKQAEKFAAAVKRAAKRSWRHDGLLIRPPEDQAELIAEGRCLHHCVGGYAGQVAEGSTEIFFVRQEAKPDEPFYTLEWRGGGVTQCRTDHNKSYESDPAVQAFARAWASRQRKRRKAAAAAI